MICSCLRIIPCEVSWYSSQSPNDYEDHWSEYYYYNIMWNFLKLFLEPQWLWGPLKCVSSTSEMFWLPGLCIWLVFPILYFQLWHPPELQCQWSRHFFVLLLLCLLCYVPGAYQFGSGNLTISWRRHFLTPSLPDLPSHGFLEDGKLYFYQCSNFAILSFIIL